MTEEPEDIIDVPAEDVNEEKQPSITDYPGVLVVRVPQEDGSQQITVVEINGHDPLASSTLLEAAVKVKRQQLNLN